MNFTAKLCPFCNEDNKCNVLEAKSCWCMDIKVPQELRRLVPETLRNKSCICKNCILEFKDDKEKFIKNLSFK